jgi:hypothetical protein
MSNKGVGVGGAAAARDIGAGGVRWVWPIVFSFGVVVVRSTRAARAGKCGYGIRLLLEVGIGLRENAVVIDGSNVGSRTRLALGQKGARSQ